MINILLGPPGGGKSYEATVFHILPALAKGRKVITNLPLDLERIEQIDSAYIPLIQIVENRRGLVPVRPSPFARFAKRQEPEEGVIRAFSTMDDYADTWRHSETGSGPLYVIDECHLCLPRGTTLIEVEEWYSLHRHESADVLLITQSYGKVSKSIVDLVQVCYRVKKATAFGSQTRYIRKVLDGVRGEVVNESIRKYEKQYFGLYKSHTRGGGEELAANDIVPIWKRWPFIGLGICTFIFICMIPFLSNPLKPKAAQPAPSRASAGAIVPAVSQSSMIVQAPSAAIKRSHPLEGRDLYVLGSIKAQANGKWDYTLFAVGQGGQIVFYVKSFELEQLGYSIDGSDCFKRVIYAGDVAFYARCDVPTVTVGGREFERDNAAPVPSLSSSFSSAGFASGEDFPPRSQPRAVDAASLRDGA